MKENPRKDPEGTPVRTARAPRPHASSLKSESAVDEARAPYDPPVLEQLGRWSAVTLQMSVPIGP